MKSAPLKLMALIFLAMLLLPLASSEDARSMEKYLDCLTDKKADIVFVFDTTGSMEGEINELSAIVRGFASDLESSRVDHRLGLVEFRDFPKTCGGGDDATCGSPGDYPYKVKGEGNLTGDISTFNSWMRELKVGGGGGPEAVLAALRHAVSNCQWRDDAEKVIIVVTDAGPHPDGDCCNAEGDTLEGTIFGLTSQGARVHVIGSEDAALRRIAGDTGGQFFKIRSGLSLKPLLKEITGAMSCSFKVEAETTCLNRTLEAKVRLVGKDVIPFVAGQTEAWMYLDQAGSKSRHNLSYDQAAGAYLANVPEVCGPVELTVYGRVGERSAVQSVQVVCGTCGASAAEEQGTLSISGRVFDDSNGDSVKGADEAGLEGWDVLLTKPDGGSNTAKTDRKGFYIFTGLIPRSYKVVANAQENWTATAPETGAKDVELVNVHESEIDFGFKSKRIMGGLPKLKEPFNRTFGGPDWDVADSVQPTPDGGYILAGRTQSFWGYINDAWLIKTDSQGHEIWNRTFGISAGYGKYSVQPIADGGYIIAGTRVLTYDDDYICLIKTDSQGYEVWKRTFVGANWYGGVSLQLATDGGYILAGSKEEDDGHGGRDEIPLLIKIDSQGNEVWEKTFEDDVFYLGGFYGSGGAYSVQPTADGGYILTGNDHYQMGSNGWLIKTDSEGHEIWGRSFADSKGQNNTINQVSVQVAYSMQPTHDGGYILAGLRTYQDENGGLTERSDVDAWLVKVDAEGNELWNRTFGETGSSEVAYSVQPTIDGGFIIAGTKNLTVSQDFTHQALDNPSVYPEESNSDAWIIKTDAKGNEIWGKTFGGMRDDFANSIQLTPDGCYILAGSTISFGAGSLDAWLLKVDAEGNIVRLSDQAD